MGRIPEDAIHWDSGDWIEWHRSLDGVDDRPCGAAAANDALAQLTALQVSLLRAAKTYYTLTGRHLPVYGCVAEVYAAIHFDVPLGKDGAKQHGIKLTHLPPHSAGNTVDVNLKDDFDMLVMVRIKDNFSVEGRMVLRNKLPATRNGKYTVSWQSLPRSS